MLIILAQDGTAVISQPAEAGDRVTGRIWSARRRVNGPRPRRAAHGRPAGLTAAALAS
jgi:hypothetical protein